MSYTSNYTGQQIDTAIGQVDNKVDKQTGKGLSTNDYTTAEKNKLAGIDMTTKQDTLVSGSNIKTINNQSVLGSGNLEIQSGGGTWGSITGTLSDQTDLNTALTNKVGNDTNTNTPIYKVWYGTEAQYEAITTKDTNTLYFTPEE